MALLLETPATEEIEYDIQKLDDGQEESVRRRDLYPGLDPQHINRGAPVVGRSGSELFSWALRAAGITRRDVYLANVLQCYPGKNPKDGTVAYPKGKNRKLAESCCSSLWWRLDQIFKPDYSIINFHPAAIIRDATPLPLQIAAFVRAKKICNSGAKVLVCCGGKASLAWFGYGENVTRWVGHVQRETELTRELRRRRLSLQ